MASFRLEAVLIVTGLALLGASAFARYPDGRYAASPLKP